MLNWISADLNALSPPTGLIFSTAKMASVRPASMARTCSMAWVIVKARSSLPTVLTWMMRAVDLALGAAADGDEGLGDAGQLANLGGDVVDVGLGGGEVGAARELGADDELVAVLGRQKLAGDHAGEAEAAKEDARGHAHGDELVAQRGAQEAAIAAVQGVQAASRMRPTKVGLP
jgi:hypothetical protein